MLTIHAYLKSASHSCCQANILPHSNSDLPTGEVPDIHWTETCLKLLLIYDMFDYHGGCCEWKKGPAKAKVCCAFCALVTIVVIWVMVSFLPHLIWPLSSELIHQQGAAICRPAVCYGIPTILIKLKKPPKTISHPHTHTQHSPSITSYIGDWINTWIFRQKGITF